MTPEFIPSSVGATHSLRFGIWSAWLFLLSRCRWLSSDHYRATCRWQSQHQQDGSTLPDGLIWLLAYLWLPIFFSHTQKASASANLAQNEITADVGDLQWNDDHFPIPIKAEQLFCLSVLLLPPIRAISGWSAAVAVEESVPIPAYHHKRCKYFRALTPHIRELDMMSYGLPPQAKRYYLSYHHTACIRWNVT